MLFQLRLIAAIVKKDIRSLLPLIVLASIAFLLQPVIASLDAIATTGDAEFLATVQANFYWVSYFMACLLMISVLQLDPADSLTHDWLARPVPRLHWLAGKLLVMVLVIVLPIIAGRFVLYLTQGYGVWSSLAFAAAIEKLPATLVVPMLFAVGLLAPNLRRAIVVMTLVFFIFLMPAWSVTRPLLEMLGIELGTEFDSMMWLQAVPIVVAGFAGTVAVFWWLVCRRQPRLATPGFAASVMLVFFTVYPPMWLLDWDKAIAIHRALINRSDAQAQHTVTLEPLQACYPASFIGSADSRTANPLLVSAGWSASQLQAAGTHGLTLATTMRARAAGTHWLHSSVTGRDMDIDWRVERIRTRASVTAQSLASEHRLTRSTTAVNRFAQMAEVDTDYWLVPEPIVQQVASDPTAQLRIDYDMALLSPQAYELPLDGEIHKLPALGACRAWVDNSANTIEVDCIKRGSQPAMMSAELPGIEASRVDRYYRANFTPDWLEVFSRRQTRLTLQHPFLVNASSVLVTAWNVERVVSHQWVADGLLGDDASTCPLPEEGSVLLADANWRDAAPHQVSFVSVEPGVRLEVLDWRTGNLPDAPTLLLLPGLGATAHSYDDIAAQLSQRYNVVAMTRRGTGASAKPDRGYDIARLSQDVLQVVNSLGSGKPVLVGHSIGGEELSFIGAHHADQVQALIYLDAAFDRVSARDASELKRYRELDAQLPSQPPVRPSETQSYQALRQYALRTQGTEKMPPEGEIMASYDLSTGINRHNSLYLDAIMMGLQAPQYSRITVPALALYAVPGSADALMEAWYDRNDQRIRETVNALYTMDSARKQAEMARFEQEVANSQVIAITDADHWIFVSHPDEVLAAIVEFVDGL